MSMTEKEMVEKLTCEMVDRGQNNRGWLFGFENDGTSKGRFSNSSQRDANGILRRSATFVFQCRDGYERRC